MDEKSLKNEEDLLDEFTMVDGPIAFDAIKNLFDKFARKTVSDDVVKMYDAMPALLKKVGSAGYNEAIPGLMAMGLALERKRVERGHCLTLETITLALLLTCFHRTGNNVAAMLTNKALDEVVRLREKEFEEHADD